MRSSPGVEGFELLVFATEAEWAREILRESTKPPIPHSVGFPVISQGEQIPVPPRPNAPPPPLPTHYTGPAIPAAPLAEQGLSERQKTNYTIAIILLWVLLVLILIILIVPWLLT
jgi:hypothetical protein